MKGMELPVNIVVITSIIVLVLVVMVFFFTSSSGKGIAEVDAQKIFFEGCSQLKCSTPKDICLEAYGQTGQSQSFYDRFYTACQSLYGGGANNAVLCFTSCGSCAKLSDEQKNYIASGKNGEGLVIDKDSLLRRCNTIP